MTILKFKLSYGGELRAINLAHVSEFTVTEHEHGATLETGGIRVSKYESIKGANWALEAIVNAFIAGRALIDMQDYDQAAYEKYLDALVSIELDAD